MFTGSLPLVFFTNMPTNASMVQNSVTFKTQSDNGKVVGHDSRLDPVSYTHLINKCDMASAMPEEVEDEIVELLGCKRDRCV